MKGGTQGKSRGTTLCGLFRGPTVCGGCSSRLCTSSQDTHYQVQTPVPSVDSRQCRCHQCRLNTRNGNTCTALVRVLRVEKAVLLSHENSWQKNTPGRGKSVCKGPQAGRAVCVFWTGWVGLAAGEEETMALGSRPL